LTCENVFVLFRFQSNPDLSVTTTAPAAAAAAASCSSNVDYAQHLKQEVERLRHELVLQQEIHEKKLAKLRLEEQNAKSENLRLQRKLQVEVDRRQQLYKQLSESESSLEMDEERALNSKMKLDFQRTSSSSSSSQYNLSRSRTASSPAFIINQTSEFLQRTHLPSTHNSME